jgi:ribosomal protein S27AE
MALFAKEFQCPSCGANITQQNPASRSISCGYCGQTSHINADSLQAAGEQHLLVDYGSFLSVGNRGRWQGQGFTILGRLRIEYEDGFWDEWYINFDNGNPAWIQEDDGSFMLFLPEGETVKVNYYDVHVGSFVDFNRTLNQVFITSKSRAKVEGGEGELPFRIVPGEIADFVEGIKDGEVISIEILPDGLTVYKGNEITLDDLLLNLSYS